MTIITYSFYFVNKKANITYSFHFVNKKANHEFDFRNLTTSELCITPRQRARALLSQLNPSKIGRNRFANKSTKGGRNPRHSRGCLARHKARIAPRQRQRHT